MHLHNIYMYKYIYIYMYAYICIETYICIYINHAATGPCKKKRAARYLVPVGNTKGD